MNAKRMIGIDIIRIYCAIIILFSHLGGWRWNIDFKGLNNWINGQVEFIMIIFFVLSGYCLKRSNNFMFHKDGDIIAFYKRRLIRILPLYYAVEVVRLIIAFHEGQVVQRIRMLPIRLFALQMEFNYDVYAGASWFIGCIIACYFIYPLVYKLFDGACFRTRIMWCMIILFIVFYSKLMTFWFDDVDIYYSTVYRVLEFSVGVIMPEDIFDKYQIRLPNVMYILVSGFLVLFLTIQTSAIVGMTVYAIKLITIPVLILFCSKIDVSERVGEVLQLVSGYTFEVFLLQDIILSNTIRAYGLMIEDNGIRLLLALTLLLFLCVAWKVIEKNVRLLFVRFREYFK